MRVLAAETGIIGPGSDPKVILISTPLEDEQAGIFAARLAEIVSESGRELIFLDVELVQSFDWSSEEPEQSDKIAHYERPSQLRDETASDRNGERRMNTQIDSAISSARKRYDVILIQARPALTSSDTLKLASVADVHLHIVRWRHTRRRPTLLALQHFTRTGVHVSGVVLTSANLSGYRRYGAADRFYYFDADKAKTTRRVPSHSTAISNEPI
jgi:Mrp family chromosome partitioning ATPase